MNPSIRIRRFGPVALLLLSLLWPRQSNAQLSVTIVDNTPYRPASGSIDTKNVGQEIRLEAVVTGGTPNLFYWEVEGEVIADYAEMEPGPFSLTDLTEEATNPPIWTSTGGGLSQISFYWRERGAVLPANRRVQVLVRIGESILVTAKTFQVERNKVDADRQPEDYYTSNHTGRVLLEHRDWHVGNNFRAVAYNGAEFFEFHRRYISRYNAWRAEFGYPAVGKYDPAGAIPAAEAGYTLADATRLAANPNLNIPAWYPRATMAKPPWFTATGDGSQRPGGEIDCEPIGGQRKLVGDVGNLASGFTSYAQLGCAVTHTWHNAVHTAIGGDMGTTASAPKDPIFWRWHNFVDDIAADWLNARAALPELPPDLASVLPPRGYGTGSLASVSVSFAEPVTGVAAGDLTVDGSAATVVNGAGRGPYEFTGFASPGSGEVDVNLANGSIVDADGLPFAGDTWTYTLGTCVDADGDGVYEGQCWPFPSFDNCPTVPNPDQADLNDNDVGDVCEGSTDVGELHASLLVLGPTLSRLSGPALRFRLSLAQRSDVHASVFDISGRRIAILVDDELAAGWHEFGWDLARRPARGRLTAGVYLLRVEAAGAKQVHKIILLQ